MLAVVFDSPSGGLRPVLESGEIPTMKELTKDWAMAERERIEQASKLAASHISVVRKDESRVRNSSRTDKSEGSIDDDNNANATDTDDEVNSLRPFPPRKNYRVSLIALSILGILSLGGTVALFTISKRARSAVRRAASFDPTRRIYLG